MTTDLESQWLKAKRDCGNHLVQQVLLQMRKMRFGERESLTLKLYSLSVAEPGQESEAPLFLFLIFPHHHTAIYQRHLPKTR